MTNTLNAIKIKVLPAYRQVSQPEESFYQHGLGEPKKGPLIHLPLWSHLNYQKAYRALRQVLYLLRAKIIIP